MKTELIDGGRQEVTTKTYRGGALSIKFLCRVSFWIETNRSLRSRQVCSCCGQRWEDFRDQEVYLAFTDEWSQCICRQCYINLAQPGVNCPGEVDEVSLCTVQQSRKEKKR